MQRALAGEHAAVHAFGLVAGRTAPERRAEAAADLDAHRVARDDLVDLLLARGAAPVEAAAGYDVEAPTPQAAAALAAAVEERLAGAHADVVAASAPDRAAAAAALLRAARAARRWGSPVSAFPGMAELGEDGTALPRASATTTTTATATAAGGS
ncbi:DUF4439 domain-containing protein [Kineococcus sp. T13]|nr:DUF4439 domain-containing protein [Kineococcus vitellinus]NAZ77613.1 DUF4439 domain-containing protein [Kineococcus vitellinus]